MKRIVQWDGNYENTEIEYDYESTTLALDDKVKNSGHISTINFEQYYSKPDKVDYLIAVSSGFLTGLLDSFWVGAFSLRSAQDWGRTNANNFVIKVAQKIGYKKDELDGAIRFLEKRARIPSDQLAPTWGGGLQHHFRDFAHHASIVGLVFSVISQFTGLSYGTNTEGHFEMHDIPDKELIGETLEEKIFNGTVIWAIHLVSDMAGSSSNAGKGTGIPGPMLSLAKELSVLPGIKELQVKYKNNEIKLSVMLSKIFNGTAFEHTSQKDLVRFDLRTEMGIYAFSIKQNIPIAINQCIVRAFYFIKRLFIEISNKKIQNISDLKKIKPDYILPRNNVCILRMLTVSSGVFCVVDTSDAAIRSFLKSPQNGAAFFTHFLFRTNFTGIGNFVISVKNDVVAHIKGKDIPSIDVDEKGSDNNSVSDNVFDNITIEISADITNTGLYEYAFYRMFNEVKNVLENARPGYYYLNCIERPLFQLMDDETEIYDNVVRLSARSLIIETENLIMRLLTFYGIDYVSLYREGRNEYIPFYRVENSKKIGYVFSGSMLYHEDWNITKDKYNLDGIKVVALVELGNDAEARDCYVDNNVNQYEGTVQYIPVKELFNLISKDEYSTYINYVETYNKDVKS